MLAAKWFGVRVDVFSIGFGKRLVGFRRGETDYRISALPLGGYVKMAGENPLESRTGAPDEFMSHPRWQRFVIAIAGPAMNIILAVALLTGVFMVHYEHPVFLDQPAVIGWVVENSPAAKAGIEQGDRIVRIDGEQNPTWEDVMLKVMISPKQPVDVAIQRGNQILEKQIQPQADGAEQYGNVGWVPDQPITVTELEPDMPAAKAGLKLGDDIVAINGLPMRSLFDVIHYLQQNGSKPVDVTAVRNGQQLHLTVTPVQTGRGRPEELIAWASGPSRSHVDKLPFAQALNRSLEENKKYSLLIVDLVRKMVERKVSIKQMEGPIGIAPRLRRSRTPAGMDSAAQPDGDDQPESRHLQPAADSHPRRRHHYAADHRGDHAPRHQHADQGTHLPDRVRLPDAVLRGRHLQRPDEGAARTGAAAAVAKALTVSTCPYPRARKLPEWCTNIVYTTFV